MRGIISEEKFKTVLQRMQKKHDKNLEVGLILQMLFNSATDILLRLLDVIVKPGWSNDYSVLDELRHIITYSNECFLDVASTFNCRHIHVTDELVLR